jgi:fibronectin-binding autotransporter adhesin
MTKKCNRRMARRSGIIAAVAALSMVNHAFAASGNWSGAANDGNLWETPGNWLDNVPGAADGTFVNQDSATFSDSATVTINTTATPVTTSAAITVDVNRNIANIVFNSPTVGFTIGTSTGNTLYLSGGGTTTATSSATSNSINSIAAPIVLAGTSYTFVNNSSITTAGLQVTGNVSGGAAGQATVLTLDGTASQGLTSSINGRFRGNLTDGVASAVGLTKTGAGTWELNSTANTYSGDTIINQGNVRFNGTGVLSPNTHIIINSGGSARLNAANNTAASLTLNTGATASASSNTVTTALRGTATLNGTATTASLIYNFATASGAVSPGGFNLFLTGTTDRSGGIMVVNGSATGITTFSKNIDVGALNRPFDIGSSSTNASVGDPDLSVSGRIQGAGGFIKLGAGSLKLNGKDQSVSGGGPVGDTFTGLMEVQAGAVRFNSANQLVNLPPILVDGGTLNVQALTQTVGNLTMSAGTIQASTGTGGSGTITASSYTFPIAAGTTATNSAILMSTGSMVKTGAGALTSSAAFGVDSINISGGSIALNSNGGSAVVVNSLSISSGTKLDLSDNDLIVNYSGASPAATIRGYLASAFNSGNWDGAGIASKSAHSNVTMNTALGYAEESDVQLASLDGVTPGASSVIVKYTYYGDTNLDGAVTTADFQRFLDGFTGHGSTWAQGDFTYDGKVDLGNDFQLFLIGYLSQNGSLGALADVVNADSQLSVAQKASLLAAVPEPCGLATLGLVAALGRRRRKPSA